MPTPNSLKDKDLKDTVLKNKSLKNRVLRGGLFLTLRQLLSASLSLVSVLVIARTLGPEKYGLIASALGDFYFLAWSGQMGLHIYLVRQPTLEDSSAEQLMAFYLTVGLLLCGVLWTIDPLFGLWAGEPEVSTILRWLTPAVWLNMLGGVPLGMLNRELSFDRISLVESLAQISNYLLSVPIVLLTHSYWGPIAGTFLQFLVAAALAYWFYPVKITLRWRWSVLKKMLSYGATFFAASWFQSLRVLTIPLLVTPLAGVKAAGIVGITVRMLEHLSLLRNVIRTMSISVMARLMDDAEAIGRAINQGMSYMALLMISVCATFACLSPWVIPVVFGPEWLQSTQIFPPIAFAASVIAVFDLHLATLHAVDRNNVVTLQNSVYMGLLWLGCWALIPPLGLWGYAIAEIIALPSFYVAHRAFSQLYGRPNYRTAALIVLAAVPSLFASVLVSPVISLVVLGGSYVALLVFSSGVRAVLWDLLQVARAMKAEKALDAV